MNFFNQAFMCRHPLLIPIFCFICVISVAQNEFDKEKAYTLAITQRAERIVKGMHLSDSATASGVRDIIITQYRNLNDIHTRKEDKINAAESLKGSHRELYDVQVKQAENEANAGLYQLHYDFLSRLMIFLDEEQIESVKDGMTYGILPITYKGYCDMIPNLTGAQKSQIMAWLVEAREHAMDAGSSEEKHAWFGKYKGRINNYLSAAGYDLKKEGEAWKKRTDEAKKR